MHRSSETELRWRAAAVNASLGLKHNQAHASKAYRHTSVLFMFQSAPAITGVGVDAPVDALTSRSLKRLITKMHFRLELAQQKRLINRCETGCGMSCSFFAPH
jgi:hypothetical protein